MKKKNVTNTIGFGNKDRLNKYFKFVKNGLLISSIGGLIATIGFNKLMKNQVWYEAADQQSRDEIMLLRSNVEKNLTDK